MWQIVIELGQKYTVSLYVEEHLTIILHKEKLSPGYSVKTVEQPETHSNE